MYGQMNEPPGARARVALTALTIAEYFRDAQGQDVLLFVDNIFRFTQACSEVSALLGRIPSAVGYQPTLATDLGALQERITSTTKGSITSVQVRGRSIALDPSNPVQLRYGYCPHCPQFFTASGDLRAGGRLDGPGAGDHLRPLGRHDRAQPADCGARHLPGRRPARLDVAHPRSPCCR